MRLVKASEMQEMDRWAIQELGIPGAVLMENAARAATRIFLEHFDCPQNTHVVIICGRGNNGGDGYVMARYLHQKKLIVTVMVLSSLDKISGDARINLDIITRLGMDIIEVPGPDEWAKYRRIVSECDIIIDGILGTGLNSSVRGFYGRIIEEINALNRPVMAIDIPSGLNADTGQVMGAAIKAYLTVTFGFPKLGQVVFPGTDLVGRLCRVDIGIPDQVLQKVPAKGHFIEPSDFSDHFKTEKMDIHKGDRGHLLILAGSTGKTGAAALTALGALRAGAGLVTVGIPQSLNSVLEVKLTEAMTMPLPDTPEGSLSLKSEGEIRQLMKGKTAMAIGPGLSTHPETTALVRRMVLDCPLPVVIDADGLNALAEALPGHLGGESGVILTPHPGEMGRLAKIRTSDVQRDRIGTAVHFSNQHGCFLVLKGARTLIADPDGNLFVNPTGNPALSSGGAGDVLTGLIGGFLARKWPLLTAAIGGVYMHGLAADFLAEDMGHSGILAGDLLDVTPMLMDSITHGDWPLDAPPPHDDLYHTL